MSYKTPPFEITAEILVWCQRISYSLGKLEGKKFQSVCVSLRKVNSIKTLCASLAIEGNTLSLDQVTDVFNGKPVIGSEKEILEVKNALQVYEVFDQIDGLCIQDLLSAHHTLMKGLSEENGKWRRGSVGIFKGETMKHLAPPAQNVPHLMKDLFDFLIQDSQTPMLLKACIFHYELEFIHPFADGNGRMGRLWQQLLLASSNPVFKYVCVEELIYKNQRSYYEVFDVCNHQGTSTPFISFSVKLIHEALEGFALHMKTVPTWEKRLLFAKEQLSRRAFSRKEYLALFEDLSSATSSRDLRQGVASKILAKQGSQNQTLYSFLPNVD